MNDNNFIPGHAYICKFKERPGVGDGRYLGIYENGYFSMIGQIFLQMNNIKFTEDYFSEIIPAEYVDVAEYLCSLYTFEEVDKNVR